MEPYEQSAVPYQQNQDRQVRLILDALIVVAAVITAILIILTVAGYGTARFTNLPSDATVRINSHTITATTVKLRPGSYDLVITSPTTTPYQTTFHIGLFRTTALTPQLVARSANATFSSVIGAVVATSTPPQPARVQWFDHNTWVVGLLVPNNVIMALHYDDVQKHWVVAFATTGLHYPHTLNDIPTNVATAISTMEATNVQ